MASFLDPEFMSPDRFIGSPGRTQSCKDIKHAYASFGESGTTVSINAYGHILQMSQFLCHDSSGFLCAEAPGLPEPYCVQSRMDALMKLTQDSTTGLRLDVVNDWTAFHDVPILDYIYDRWPRYVFTNEPKKESTKEPVTPQSSLSIQYFCHEDSVVQNYVMDVRDGGISADILQLDCLHILPEIGIRDLDFVDGHNHFNENPKHLEKFKISDGTVVFAHRLPDETRKPPAAALVVSVFVDGHAAIIGRDCCITVPLSAERTVLDITVVYKLQIFSHDQMESFEPYNLDKDLISEVAPTPMPEDNESSMLARALTDKSIEEAETAVREMARVFLEDKSFRQIYFSPDPRLDFAFRRNLEHILSVCSIPVGEKAFAITCGDIAGHRIGPRASLSAVQYLHSMLSYINPNNDDSKTLRDKCQEASPHSLQRPSLTKEQRESEDALDREYLQKLRDRIQSVLTGHLRWICQLAEASKATKFSPHHWPTGESIDRTNKLPPATVLDTPLQLLKIPHGLGLDPEESSSAQEEWVRSGLVAKVDDWIENVHTINERGTYAFARPVKDDDASYSDYEQKTDAKYSLTDHVMIALTFKCIDQLQLSGSGRSRMYYPYDQVRVLKRFTTEHSISKQRMLATSRWAHKTRFLLHSKDMFLFSLYSLELFKDPYRARNIFTHGKKDMRYDEVADAWSCVDQRWARMLECQVDHDDYRDFQWCDPLRYAIVFILGCRNIRVSSQSAAVAIRMSLSVLLRPSRYNGLFAGLLDANDETAMHGSERERDNHWFSAFEVPRILWIYRTTDEFATAPSKPKGLSAQANPLKEPPQSNKDVPKVGQRIGKYVHSVNLGSSKDQVALDVLADDWLQIPPPILDFEPFVPRTDRGVQRGISTSQELEFYPEKILRRFSQPATRVPTGAVIDVAKWSLGTEINMLPQTCIQMWTALEMIRSIWDSKKRIVWLPQQNRTVVDKCYRVSSSGEKDSLLLFLRRHVKSETYFFDFGSATTNEWETEMHMSFFQLIDHATTRSHNIGLRKHLVSTTSSFRFFGDFSDRFWTCHFLEHGPDRYAGTSLAERLLPSVEYGIRDGFDLMREHNEPEPNVRRFERGNRQKPWQQRRVLELLIYSKLLEKLRKNSDDIFGEVRSMALRSKVDDESDSELDPFRKGIDEARKLQKMVNEEEYFTIALTWRDCIQILLVVEENLGDNIEKINEWSRRENERQHQQPRWTKADEQNHRLTRSKLEVYTRKQAREAERLKDQIRNFQKSLPRHLESLREDINLRGSQNTNLFTYVTVVFLPLGFATGLLSMNGAPDRSLVLRLTTLSLAALGITLLALLNARIGKAILTSLTRIFQEIVQRLFDVLCQAIQVLLNASWQATKYAFFFNIAVIYYRAHRRRNEERSKMPWLALILVLSMVATHMVTPHAVSKELSKQTEVVATARQPSCGPSSQPQEGAPVMAPPSTKSCSKQTTHAGLRDTFWARCMVHAKSGSEESVKRFAARPSSPEPQPNPQQPKTPAIQAMPMFPFRMWYRSLGSKYEEIMRFSYRAAVRGITDREITVLPVPKKVLSQIRHVSMRDEQLELILVPGSTTQVDVEKGLPRSPLA